MLSAINVFCGGAIARRRDAGGKFEDFAKMRLVREASLQSDYRERRIGLHQLAPGSLDAQLSNILPHSTAVVLPKLAG